jgi:hypothetical protein
MATNQGILKCRISWWLCRHLDPGQRDPSRTNGYQASYGLQARLGQDHILSYRKGIVILTPLASLRGNIVSPRAAVANQPGAYAQSMLYQSC